MEWTSYSRHSACQRCAWSTVAVITGVPVTVTIRAVPAQQRRKDDCFGWRQRKHNKEYIIAFYDSGHCSRESLWRRGGEIVGWLDGKRERNEAQTMWDPGVEP